MIGGWYEDEWQNATRQQHTVMEVNTGYCTMDHDDAYDSSSAHFQEEEMFW
jgi:hypothetical protein